MSSKHQTLDVSEIFVFFLWRKLFCVLLLGKWWPNCFRHWNKNWPVSKCLEFKSTVCKWSRCKAYCLQPICVENMACFCFGSAEIDRLLLKWSKQNPVCRTSCGIWRAPWKNQTSRYISFFHPSLNCVPFPMFCLLVEGECQILVF